MAATPAYAAASAAAAAAAAAAAVPRLPLLPLLRPLSLPLARALARPHHAQHPIRGRQVQQS
jgi:hypothetical protein